MKKLITGSMLSALLISTGLQALDRKQCTSEIFKRFQLVERSGYNKAYARPKGDLLKLTQQYELTCPWQVERDLNDDGKLDWVGVAEKKGQYSLIAYLSGTPRYKVQTIKQYPSFPQDSYLTLVYFKELKRIMGKPNRKSGAKFSLVENQLRKNSIIYRWNGEQLEELYAYSGDYKIIEDLDEITTQDNQSEKAKDTP